jgi:peptidyl-prolyl cis-trans isomerase SurA
MKYCRYYLFMLFFFMAVIAQAATQSQVLDRVVAVVNDDVITQSQLNLEVKRAQKALLATGAPNPGVKKLQQDVLNQMIDKTIELQMAKRYGVDVTPDAVTQSIENIAARNHVSVSELKTMVVNSGISWTDYRKQLKEQMVIREVLDRAIGGSIQISDQDLKNAMASPLYINQTVSQYDLGDILIPLSDDPTPEALREASKKANKVLQQLNSGARFETVAAANSVSEDNASSANLGWKSLDDLPTVFADEVKLMKVGQVVGPIRTGNGFHILKLLNVKQKVEKHFVTETDVRHILIKTESDADNHEAKVKLEKIRADILRGADFDQMAKRYSQDTGSASKGGNLGWVPPGILVPEFEQAMNHLALNQISEPVKTQYGWHIIQVLHRRQVDDTAHYQENEIRRMIYQKKFEEEAQRWLARMKDVSYIKVTL